MLVSLDPSLEALGETEAEDQKISRTFSCEIPFQEAVHASAKHREAHGQRVRAEAASSLLLAALVDRSLPNRLLTRAHLSSSSPWPRPHLAPPHPVPASHGRFAFLPPTPHSVPASRPQDPAARADVRVRSDAPRLGLSWAASPGPRRPAPPPRPPRGGAHRPGRRAPLTREAAALAVAPAPLQHEEGVGSLRHPQRVGHQHLLRAQPHRGAVHTGPWPARRKRRGSRRAEPSGRGGARRAGGAPLRPPGPAGPSLSPPGPAHPPSLRATGRLSPAVSASLSPFSLQASALQPHLAGAARCRGHAPLAGMVESTVHR